MSGQRNCPDCGGPRDILHTLSECQAIRQAQDVPEVDRYHLSVVALIVSRAGSPMAAAQALYRAGLLKPPKAAT